MGEVFLRRVFLLRNLANKGSCVSPVILYYSIVTGGGQDFYIPSLTSIFPGFIFRRFSDALHVVSISASPVSTNLNDTVLSPVLSRGVVPEFLTEHAD